ncbi:hypothetical protein L3X38_021858 [Prunus dulcis]|uniref:Uncharacterized protein n=1 Tax=Prunus dulcis TaxID=3755 RepID=A0AAD4Z307_PRUDU|nr:hypothetical protein L3X38_021858 [Prunus dulcis]
MGDHPGKLLVSSQEQNREGQRGGAQSGQYRATAELIRDVTIWYQSHSALWCECADEDVGPLRGVDCIKIIINYIAVAIRDLLQSNKDNYHFIQRLIHKYITLLMQEHRAKFDPCNCENCNENCLGVQSNFNMQFIDQNSEEMRIDKTFKDIIDFIGINIFTWKVAKNLVDFVNRLKILERNFCISRGSKKPRITKYSKYLFIWKGRFQLDAKRSRINMKQLKILFGFSSIKGLNSRTNSFQPREFDAGA